jgi:hypothetical protein
MITSVIIGDFYDERMEHAALQAPPARRGRGGEHNRKPKPFVWTADPDRIIEKVNRGHQAIASDH